MPEGPQTRKENNMEKEDIEALKKGDKIRLELTVAEVDGKEVYLRLADGAFFTTAEKMAIDGIMFNGEKVEPRRAFDVGDVVSVIPDPLTGTVYGEGRRIAFFTEELVTVMTRANEVGDVVIQHLEGLRQVANVHCLKLVKKTPMNTKYRTIETDEEWQIVDESGNYIASFGKLLHPNAAAAAEAECTRLNDAWRALQETAPAESCGATKGGAK